MNFVMKTYYRVEFLPPVVSFVTAVARCLGASDKEMSDLGMAAEEAGMHIIGRYPGDGLSEQFEVVCEVQDDGLRVVFSNMGLPINLLELPRYEAERMEETIDGLGLFLMGKLVDHYEFVNAGREGWRTVLFKRFAHLHVPTSGQTATQSGGGTESRESLRAVQAGVEHVAGIVELAYRSYGYSYSKALFYFADQLRAALLSGTVKSFIALNPSGLVVGQIAVLYSPESSDVAEVGALMVRPEYRQSTGLLQLIKAVIRGVRNQPGSPAIGETNLVTTHTLSQRASALFQFKPMALKLSLHGRARFVQLAEEASEQRESLLHTIFLLRPVQPLLLHVPPRHEAMTRRLFGNAGLALELAGDAAPLPARTTWSAESHTEAGWGLITLREPGADYLGILRKQLFDMESDGIKTIYVRFPGWIPQPGTLEHDARALRLFFSGWVVEAPDRWWLHYTRLNAQRFDFQKIQLCDQPAQELRDYVEQCFKETIE